LQKYIFSTQPKFFSLFFDFLLHVAKERDSAADDGVKKGRPTQDGLLP